MPNLLRKTFFSSRCPTWIETVLTEFERGDSSWQSITQAREASAAIPGAHFRFKPEWRRLAAGERPPAVPENLADEPGIWRHGWQFYVSSATITLHKESVVFPSLDDATKARVRSQGGA